MPYREFEGLKRVVNELAGVRGALQQVISERAPREMVEWSLRENDLRVCHRAQFPARTLRT
jgi:hypothetical protein